VRDEFRRWSLRPDGGGRGCGQEVKKKIKGARSEAWPRGTAGSKMGKTGCGARHLESGALFWLC
jgi:hypothetical protein